MKDYKRTFWVPYDVCYADYKGNPVTHSKNFEVFEIESVEFVNHGKERLFPETFLYFRDHFASRLEKIAEDTDGNKEAFMKAAIDELSGALSQGEYLLSEGEAIAIGIELGRYLAMFEAVEHFEKVVARLAIREDPS